MIHGRFNSSLKWVVKFSLVGQLFFTTSLQAAQFTIDTSRDAHDILAGDGICETNTANCSLRAALEESNALVGLDKIILPSGNYIIRSGASSLLVTDDLDILGTGASTIVDGGQRDRVFTIYSPTAAQAITVTISAITIQNGLTQSSLPNGILSGYGGGLFVGEMTDLALNNVVIRNNLADIGGSGIFVGNNVNTLVINNSVIENNGPLSANNKNNIGAGIYIEEGDVTLQNSTVTGNSGHLGGGLYIAGDITTLINSTISNNHAKKTRQNATGNTGGGIFVTGLTTTLNVINSTVSGNLSDGNGAGISMDSNTVLDLSSSTISNNQADADHDGSGRGGGLFGNTNLIVNLKDTIIANNTDNKLGPDCAVIAGSITSGGYNLIGDNSACFFTPSSGDLIGSKTSNKNPLLASLTNNGGSTTTHSLKRGSPAIDAGNPTGCYDHANVLLVTDQRGVAGDSTTSRAISSTKTAVARCDIGSYEVDNNATSVVANAGPDQVVDYNSLVTLDGSKSHSKSGIDQHSWIELSNSGIKLKNTTLANPTFLAPATSQTLKFKLTVTDKNGIGSTNNASVSISVNQAPVANAGSDQIVAMNSNVVLDATDSVDPDGTIKQYHWSFVRSIPAGTAIILTSSNKAKTSFTATGTASKLVFELKVTDNLKVSSSDLVNVTVNNLPIAHIKGLHRFNYGDLVMLDGSQSSAATGTIQHYSWSQEAGTGVKLSNRSIAISSFKAPDVPGEMKFKLTITDTAGSSDTAHVSVFINEPPVSHAGDAIKADINELVSLSGSNSFDNDGTITNYRWLQLDGSTVVLSSLDTQAVKFTAPKNPESLSFRLTVIDNDHAQSSDVIRVVVNNPANSTADSSSTIGGGGGGCSFDAKSKFDPLLLLLLLMLILPKIVRRQKV